MLIDKKISNFLEGLASNSPTPGGGSVAALAGALGAALISMVSNLTIGKKKYEDVEKDFKKIISSSEKLRYELSQLIEEDVKVFNNFMATLIAPVLIRLMAENTHLILPHMFVFYYGILADITPPVMLAVFAGAAIAKAPAMKVGIESTKLAIPGYTLPFMFIFHPEIISWNFTADLNLAKLGFFLLLATVMSIGIAGGMQGYLIRKTKYYERMMLLTGSFMIIPANYMLNVLGLVLIGVTLMLQILFKKQEVAVLEK